MLGVLLLSFFVAFLLAEGAVRIRQYFKYGSLHKELYQSRIDPASGLTVLLASQKTGTIQVNSLGFRGPEIGVPKPDGDIRLAFLGSSTTFCAENSSNEATWPDLVWQELQRSYPQLRFDYVNAGFPGYVVEESLTNLQDRVAPLHPDVIVIYEATNDLAIDTREMARRQGIFSGKPETHSWLAKYSLLVNLIELNLQIKERQRKAAQGVARLEFVPAALSQGFHERLRGLVADAQKVAPVVAVATFSVKMRRDQPPAEQLKNASSSLYYMPYMSIKGLLDGFDEYNRVIRQVAQETGAILIDGENEIPGDDAHFNDSVHFKDPGSAVMARRVAATLKQAPAFLQLCQSRKAQTAKR